MDVERHRRILETILSRAKDEEDVVKRLSNYMGLLLYCYEEAEEVRGYFTLVLEEKGLDTLQIASLVNRSGKRYASTRLTAKAEKRLAEVRARLDRGEAPDSYAYELFAELEERKGREGNNTLLSPIEIRQAKRTARMMGAVRSLFKAAKVVGLALVPAFIVQKLSAAGSAGAAGTATASATAGAVATGGAIAAPAGVGLATVIPIAAGAMEAAAPIVAPIAGKVVAGWVATGLFVGASGVVAYEATAGKPVIPTAAHTITASPDEQQGDNRPESSPEPFGLPQPTDSETPAAQATPESADADTPSPTVKGSQQAERFTNRSTLTPTASDTPSSVETTPVAEESPTASAQSSNAPTPTPAATAVTANPEPSPDATPTLTPTTPIASPTATPEPTTDPSGEVPLPGTQAPSASPTGTPEASPTATTSGPLVPPFGGDASVTGSGLLSWIAYLIG